MSTDYERKLKEILADSGWVVVRAAGSLGKGDLIGIKPGHENSPVIIEVKKTKDSDVFYASTDPEQFEMMSEHAEQGINSCYAVRHTSGSMDNRWRIHWLDGNEDSPKVMRREEGKDLDKFL